MPQVVFKNRKLNMKKLLLFGFETAEKGYAYHVDMMDGQMRLSVTAAADGILYTEVTDNSSGEEYILHLVPKAAGAFVGRVRAEYGAILEEISAKCFDMEVFQAKQTQAVLSYVKDTYGDEPQYLWQKFPDNAVVRRRDNQKWYLALLTVSKRKLGFDTDEPIEILDFRMKPEAIETLVDHKKYFPGYHMNKKHWITICLDGTLPLGEICSRIDESYLLALR